LFTIQQKSFSINTVSDPFEHTRKMM